MSFPLSAGGTAIVDTPPFWEGRGLSFQPIFQKGVEGLTGPLRGVAGKEGADLFQGTGLQFSYKNKLKSEIFNDKKVYKQKYFSLS